MVQPVDERLVNRLTAAEQRPTNVPGFADVEAEPTALQKSRQRVQESLTRIQDEGVGFDPKLTGLAKVFEAPGIKQIGQAFEAFEHHVVDPIAGQVYGWGLEGLAGLQGEQALTDKARASLDLFRSLENSGEYNRQRDEFFPMEKFISSLIFDPTTYIGMGVYTKLPKAGFVFKGRKIELSLGALEQGYMDAMGYPFRKISQQARKLPKGKGQRVQAAMGLASKYVNGVKSEVAQGKRITEITTDEIQSFWQKMIRVGNRRVRDSYQDLSENARHVYDIVVTGKPVGWDGTKGTFDINKWRKVWTNLDVQPSGFTEQGMHSVQKAVDDALAGHVKLRDASKLIISTLGDQASTAKIKKVSKWLETEKKQLFSELNAIGTEITGETFSDFVVAKAGYLRTAQVQTGFELWAERQGNISGLLKGLDKFQTRVIQNGFNKWIARPFASSVLMSPNFVLDEAMEGLSRQILGRGNPGFRNRLEFLTDIVGVEDLVPPELLREELASQTVRTAAGIGTSTVGFTEISNKLLGLMSGNQLQISQSLSNKLSFFGKRWLDKAQDLSLGLRRKYLSSKMYQRIGDMLEGSYKPIVDTIETVPDTLTDVPNLAEITTIRAALAGADGLDNLAKELLSGEYRRKELAGLVDEMTGDLLDTRARLPLFEWIDAGASPLALPDAMQRVSDIAYQNLATSTEALAFKSGAALEMLKKLNLSNPLDAQKAFRISANIFNDLSAIPSQLNSSVTHRIRVGRLTGAGLGKRAAYSDKIKAELYEGVRRQIDDLYRFHDGMIDDLRDILNQVQPGLGNHHKKKYELLSKKWRAERAEIAEHFNKWTGERTSEFWTEFDQIRLRYWDNQEFFDEYALIESEILSGVKRAFYNGDLPEELKKLPPLVIEADEPLTMKQVMRMVGTTDRNIINSIAEASLGGRSSFVAAVRVMAQDFKVTAKGDLNKQLSDFYDRVLARTLNIGAKQHSGWEVTQRTLDGFANELKLRQGNPRVLGAHNQQDLLDYIEGVKRSLSEHGDDALKGRARNAVGEAVEDLKQNFVNYEDQNIVDAMMATIFPFWTYESRRLPYLFQQGLTHPKAWDVFGPEGSFYTETDNGYFGDILGYQANIFGGTFFNTGRRFFQEPYPGQSAFESLDTEWLQRGGFHFGPVQRFMLDELFGEGEAGDLITPAFALPLATLGSLPVIGGRISRIQHEMFGDKFAERRMIIELVNMRLPVTELDMETLRPKDGATRLTQADIDKAWQHVSHEAFFENFTGKTRYRGPEERRIQTEVEAIYAEAGVSRETQRLAKRYGVPLNTLVALSPQKEAVLRAIPGYDDRIRANAPLLSGERGARIEKTRDFWDRVDAQNLIARNEKEALNSRWLRGELEFSDWRKQIQAINARSNDFIHTLRGRKFDPLRNEWVKEGGDPNSEFFDVPVTTEELEEYRLKYGTGDEPLKHPLKELVQEYRSIQPDFDEETGTFLWHDFFNAREDFEKNWVPDEFREEFEAVLDDELTEVEKEMRNLHRGSLGAYWNIEDDVVKKLKAEKVLRAWYVAKKTNNEEELKQIQKDPRYRLYKRQVNILRERLRLTDPVVDYALRVFGFTKEFKNRTAREWYNEDGRTPSLARLR